MNKYFIVILLFSILTNLYSHGEKSDEKAIYQNKTFFIEDDDFTEIVIEMTNWDFSMDKIELVKGKNYRLTFITKEGHHGIHIPDFEYKSLNLKLNESISFDIHVDKEEEFRFFCYIPCGKGHRDMIGYIRVK